MALRIRKEQGLFLVVLLLGAWLGQDKLEEHKESSRVRSKKELKYSSPEIAKPFTTDPSAAPKVLRDIFREPSETSPLPPKALKFPELQPLPVVILPLPLGAQAGAYHGLRRPWAKVKVVAAGKGAAAVEAVAPEEGPALQQGQDHSLRYDRLEFTDGRVFFGYFVGPDKVKYSIGNKPGPYRVDFKFRWIEPKDGSTQEASLFGGVEGAKVASLKLAKTLKNEIELKAIKIPMLINNLKAQREFILWLLEKAKREPWVYKRAVERTEGLLSVLGKARIKEQGYRLKARVLRAQGNLSAEWKLYKTLPPDLQGSSFQLRGMGEVQAILSLDKEAEQSLRRAVQIDKPIDPRNHMSLAELLLWRERPAEALAPALRAVEFSKRNDTSPFDELRCHRTLVWAHLALGDVAAAQAALPVTGPEQEVERKYLEAAVRYARGEFAEALELYKTCQATGTLADAELGIAACQLLLGKHDEARQAFQNVIDQNPRLRHLGLGGLGLLAEREDQETAALGLLEEAILVHPGHPYLLYLLGRQRRLTGDWEGAIQALRQALRKRDDLLEALAELAVTYVAMFEANDDIEALNSAILYVDRLVALDQEVSQERLFVELQGKIHYLAHDLRGAKAALETKKEESENCKLGLAIVDYSQKREDLARERLRTITRTRPLGNPFRSLAQGLLDEIEAHAQKVQIRATFDQKLSKSWITENNGKVKPNPSSGRLVMAGTLGLPGQPVLAGRRLAGAGRFVSLEADMILGVNHDALFSGLALRTEARGATPSLFQIKLGVDENLRAHITLIDGRGKEKDRQPVYFDDVVVTRGEQIHLGLAMEEEGGSGQKTQKTLVLVATWNGEVVHRRKLKTIRRNSSKSLVLNTELRLEGQTGRKVELSFDNFKRIQLRN